MHRKFYVSITKEIPPVALIIAELAGIFSSGSKLTSPSTPGSTETLQIKGDKTAQGDNQEIQGGADMVVGMCMAPWRCAEFGWRSSEGQGGERAKRDVVVDHGAWR